MPHDSRKLLDDIRRAADSVQQFTAGGSFAEYSANLLLRSAVERQFEILGEALTRLARLDASLASRISHHRRIIDFRHILAHGYDIVDHAVVWDVIQKDLPVLQSELAEILKSLATPSE
jgi:uncharacterized protein with HEPN domain